MEAATHADDSRSKTIRVPVELHKQVSRIALDREVDKKVIAAEAIRLGLAAMQSAPSAA